MLAIFQFPICDARRFCPSNGLRRELPDWPDPETDIRPHFIHHVGRAVARRKTVDDVLPDDMKFCRAHRALRFLRLETQFAGRGEKRFRPVCAFRRLFCDGGCVVRLEVGVAHQKRQPGLTDLTEEDVLSIAADLCGLPTKVPRVGGVAAEDRLIKQGRHLCELYARGTLPRTADRPEIALGLVQDGSPLLLIEVEPWEAEMTVIPDGFTLVPLDDSWDVHLAYGRLKTRFGIIGTWIAHRLTNTNLERARRLRLCLLRLHAEQEVLDIVLKQIQRGRILNPETEEVVEELNQYLNVRTRFIDRQKWAGIDQSALRSAMDAAEHVVPPGTRRHLIERYDGARREIMRKVNAFQERRTSVRLVRVVNVSGEGTYVEKAVTINQSGTGNILNVAEFMNNVTNTVNTNLAESKAGDEVKALIKELNDQIAKVGQAADPKLTQQMGQDLQTLSAELAQPEPRRKWYELSLDGIKEAAEAVGEIAGPVVKTVQKLALLLL